MRKEKDKLGDLADYDPVFNEGKVHGVILVTAKSEPFLLTILLRHNRRVTLYRAEHLPDRSHYYLQHIQ